MIEPTYVYKKGEGWIVQNSRGPKIHYQDGDLIIVDLCTVPRGVTRGYYFPKGDLNYQTTVDFRLGMFRDGRCFSSEDWTSTSGVKLNCCCVIRMSEYGRLVSRE